MTWIVRKPLECVNGRPLDVGDVFDGEPVPWLQDDGSIDWVEDATLPDAVAAGVATDANPAALDGSAQQSGAGPATEAGTDTLEGDATTGEQDEVVPPDDEATAATGGSDASDEELQDEGEGDDQGDGDGEDEWLSGHPLPEDFPGRKALLDAGFNTLEAVATIRDFDEVPGIGQATEKKIVDRMKELGWG